MSGCLRNDSVQETTSLTLFLVVLPLVIPGHLNRLQRAFVRFGRIVSKTVELSVPFVQVREANLERVQRRELFEESQGDVFGCVPGESGHQIFVPLRTPRTA